MRNKKFGYYGAFSAISLHQIAGTSAGIRTRHLGIHRPTLCLDRGGWCVHISAVNPFTFEQPTNLDVFKLEHWTRWLWQWEQYTLISRLAKPNKVKQINALTMQWGKRQRTCGSFCGLSTCRWWLSLYATQCFIVVSRLTTFSSILCLSGLYERLEDLVQGSVYTIYGDPAYSLRPLLQKPFMGSSLTATE